jgi:hypothetical protein
MHFLVIKCASFLFKIGDDIRKLKLVKLIKKHIWMDLFQMCTWPWKLRILKIIFYQKILIFMLFKTWMYNLNNINQDVVRKYLYLTQNYV